jgi:hypothetical protein
MVFRYANGVEGNTAMLTSALKCLNVLSFHGVDALF